jgi:hypothetical protein
VQTCCSQSAIRVSLACQSGSLPVAQQLYLPKDWADDLPRREKTGVPQDVEFATKPAIALAHFELAPSQWQIVEWPEGHKEPMKYWLSTLPEEVPVQRMVF